MHRSLTSSLRTRGQRNVKKFAKKIFGDTDKSKTPKYDRRYIDKLFWLVIYSVGAFMAALTCYNLYRDYEKHPVSLNIISALNESMTLPDATLCLPTYHISELIDRSINNTSLKELADVFFSEPASWEEARNTSWPVPILYLAQSYLDVIFATESLQGYQQEQQPLQQMLKKEDNVSEAIVDVLIPRLIEWNATLKEFIEAFAEKFKRFFPVAVIMGTKNSEEEEEEQSLDHIIQGLMFVTKYQVCYKISLAEIGFTTESSIKILTNNYYLNSHDDRSSSSDCSYWDYFTNFSSSDSDSPTSSSCFSSFSYYSSSYYNSSNAPHDTNIYSKEPLTIDFSGEVRPGKKVRETNFAYTADYEMYTQLTINPTIKHVLMPLIRGKQECSVEATIVQCQAECRSGTVKKLCKCPTSAIPPIERTNDNFTSITGCLIGQYETCLLQFIGSEDASCMNECQDSCLRYEYDVQKEEVAMINMDYFPYRYLTAIEITVSVKEYLIFQQYSEQSAVYLFGGMGGAIGLWLGLDIFIILNTTISSIGIFLLDKSYAYFSANKTQSRIESLSKEIRDNSKCSKVSFAPFEEKSRDWDTFKIIKWTIRKLIWFALFFSGAAMTVKIFQQILDDFKNGGAKYSLEVQYNKTIYLPPSAICVSMSRSGTEFSPNRKELFEDSEIDENIDNLGSRMFDAMKANESWSPIIHFMAYSYLEAAFTEIILGHEIEPISVIQRHTAVLTAVRADMSNWSITGNELLQKMGNDFVKRFNISIECYSAIEHSITRLIPYLFTLEAAPTQESFDTALCVHFPLDRFAFRSVNDYCLISAIDVGTANLNMQPYYWAIKSSNSYDLKADAKMKDFREQDVIFSYTTIYQFRNANCSLTYASPLICTEMCRQEMMDAIDIACANISTIDKTIAWTEYLNCSREIADDWREKCSSKCRLSSCIRAEYETLEVQNNGVLIDSNDMSRKMKIRFQEFNYPEFSEKAKITRGEFLASIGGVLGLWLGIDAIFLISAAIVPILLIVNFYLRSSAKVGAPQQGWSDTEEKCLSSTNLAKIMGINTNRLSRPFIVKALLERIFWIGVHLGLGAMACSSCVELYKQSVFSPIKTTVENIRNHSFVIPYTTLCLPFMESEFNDSSDDSYKLDYKLLNILKTSANISQGMCPSWTSMALFLSVHRYLTLLDSYKAAEKNNIGLMWSLFTSSSQNFDNKSRAVDILYSTLQQLHITDDQLKQIFGQELLRLYKVDVAKYESINGSLIGRSVPIEQTIFVSEAKVCYALPVNSITFHSAEEYISIKADKRELPSTRCNYLVESGRFCDNCEITLDLLGRETGGNDDKLVLIGAFGYKRTMAIKVTDMIRSVPIVNGVQRCSETTGQETCMKECRIRAIEEQCNCTDPHVIENGNKKREDCSYEHFKRSLPHFSTQSLSNCMKNCLPDCERLRYSSYLNKNVEWGRYWWVKHCKADISINAVSFQYLVYNEKFAWPILNLLAALGSIIDLWLGIDAIWLVDKFATLIGWIFFKWGCVWT